MYLALTRSTRPLPRLARLLSAVLSAIFLARQRRALHDLDDHMLNDIGLTRSEAEREAARPFWDAPGGHWRQ